FNYRGQFARGRGLLTLVSTPHGPAIWERLPPTNVFSVSGSIIEGRLGLDWEYREELHRKTTVEILMGSLVESLRTFVWVRGRDAVPGLKLELAPPATSA